MITDDLPVLKFWKVVPGYVDRSAKKKVKAVLPPPKVVETVCCSSGSAGFFDLPSENVVFGNVRPVIQQGRYWRSFQFFCEHHTSDRDAQGRKTESKHYEWTVLIEIYEDSGSDGHIEYQLAGFAEIRESVLEKFLEEIERAKHRWEYPRWKIPYEEISG